ncbi:MAG: citramalate synthase [Sphaerochaetaceae bacterium]|jgi:2-isopropylmalate synthase|nr:citramalate synthase [Sphaerochaetaceae bacterium]MDD4220069.1 citramalate synthase [Sphaerochaetaceae bacterium]MDY0370868.1 citramalate synthase [Sphaerochaetaceae bacterium]
MDDYKKQRVTLFDSTLRDGAQAEGISFSVLDKLKIVTLLDDLGVDYVEAGNPGSNPKDLEFFQEVATLPLSHVRLVAFGSTRRRNILPEEDGNIRSLLAANTPVVAIFGKSWDFQVTDIIRTSLKENLAMIRDTIEYLVSHGKEVVFDAEHFFDGYNENPSYAMECLFVAAAAGAASIALCDTRGGATPSFVGQATKDVVEALSKQYSKVIVGIHTHNDTSCADANSLLAVEAGARQVQGTLAGFGERSGNACLATIIPTLQVKMGYDVLSPEMLAKLTLITHSIAEIANISIPHGKPYIGRSAFAHKGGMHIDGIAKNPRSFEHMDPELVGNERRVLMSEVAGRATILRRIQKYAPEINKSSPETKQIMDALKRMEFDGYQFEGAESSFELVIAKHLGKYKPYFTLDHYKTFGERPLYSGPETSHTAVVKVAVNGETAIAVAQGDGPVHALDKALRKVLENFYPLLATIYLTDFKVRVLDSKQASAAKVRVLIETSDGEYSWSTVGVSTDIIEASWMALVDAIEYKLMKEGVLPPVIHPQGANR